MVTALVEMDPTMGNDIYKGNWICVLVATRGDGTPLCPTSFKEEDMVKLCIRLGQEYSEGALQLWDTEVVLAFQHNTDMMDVMHCFTVAMI